MSASDITYVHGIPDKMRSQAVSLYDDAFGQKFAVAIPNTSQRTALLSASLHLPFAFAGIKNGRLVGLAGYKSEAGSLTDGMTYKLLLKNLGVFRGHWAALIFSLYERTAKDSELLMDGIVVDPDERGQGIGTRLLAELSSFAKQNGFDSIRLDVIDTNPNARRMYERNEFSAVRTEHFSYLRWLLGFGASTTLIRNIQP